MNYRLRMFSMTIIDAAMVIIAVYLALFLRFDGEMDPQYFKAFISLIPWLVIINVASLYIFRIYNRMWQYASLGELFAIIKAVSAGMVTVVVLIYTIPLPYLPRSVYILAWGMMIALIGGSRLGWRVLRDFIILDASSVARRTLIIGAGDGGALVARELKNNPGLNLQPVGFIDDSRFKQNLSLYGIPVLGNRKAIPHIVEHYGIEEIIIAMPSASGRVIRELIGICSATPAKLRIFQGASDLLSQRSRIRNIELEDLLRREPVQLNLQEIAAYLNEKTVLVSGAGGSIGSELCRQICSFKPSKLIVLDYSENNLFDIENELRDSFPDIKIEPELVDIKDRQRLQTVFSRSQPVVVFHAAAHKHVPMMEKHPVEAIKNNILGTKNMAEIADKYGVDTFIQISTDKAVNPTSVMGATKRIAEMIIQDINQTSKTRFAAVRFGNVLGSRGSVIPIFKKQIENGGPVKVTHPDMTRYFMTIPEAVQLVIEAGAMAKGGEIFVLDMGEPVKIVDLAKDLIRLHGYEPEKDIKIEFFGTRPGEKLYEELFSSREQMAATKHDRIFISEKEDDLHFSSMEIIDTLFARNAFINTNEAVELISRVLPEYQTTNQAINT